MLMIMAENTAGTMILKVLFSYLQFNFANQLIFQL